MVVAMVGTEPPGHGPSRDLQRHTPGLGPEGLEVIVVARAFLCAQTIGPAALAKPLGQGARPQMAEPGRLRLNLVALVLGVGTSSGVTLDGLSAATTIR